MSNQRGTVRERGKRRRMWVGYYQAKMPDGRWQKRSKVLGAKAKMTKTEAKAKLVAFLQGPALPVVASVVMSYQEAAARYLALKTPDWSKSVATDNNGLFRNHILPAIGDKPVSKILPSDIKDLWNRNTSSKSHMRQVATLTRGVFEMLVDDGIIPRNPAKTRLAGRLPKTKRPERFYLSVKDAQKLLKAAYGTRDYLILRCLFAFGGRPGEVLALRVNDLKQGRIRIDESNSSHNGLKEPKTEASEDDVPIPSDLEALLRAHVANDGLGEGDFLFPSETGGPMSVNNYRRRNLARIAEAAGIARVDLRCLRRTVATHLQNFASVVSTQRLMRHADVETTLENYQQPIPSDVIKAVNGWNRVLMARKKRMAAKKKVPR